jgi:SAM-dependent methyltransferase
MNSTELHIDPVGEATLAVISNANRFNRWMFDTIRPFLKGEILEVGSGIGNISQFAVSSQMQITLSDFSPFYKEQLEQKYGKTPNVRGITSIDLQHPHFAQAYERYRQRFDTIFMLNVIEHLQDDVQAVKNCGELLQPGGHLITLAPAYQFLFCRLDRELGHFRRYTTKTLALTVEAGGMSVIKKSYFNFLGTAGWLVSGKILRSKGLGSSEMKAFNGLVPFAKFIDRLVAQKAGLSAIVIGQKE